MEKNIFYVLRFFVWNEIINWTRFDAVLSYGPSCVSTSRTIIQASSCRGETISPLILKIKLIASDQLKYNGNNIAKNSLMQFGRNLDLMHIHRPFGENPFVSEEDVDKP